MELIVTHPVVAGHIAEAVFEIVPGAVEVVTGVEALGDEYVAIQLVLKKGRRVVD